MKMNIWFSFLHFSFNLWREANMELLRLIIVQSFWKIKNMAMITFGKISYVTSQFTLTNFFGNVIIRCSVAYFYALLYYYCSSFLFSIKIWCLWNLGFIFDFKMHIYNSNASLHGAIIDIVMNITSQTNQPQWRWQFNSWPFFWP